MGVDLNFTDMQQATIISGFYYGYTPLQVLGGAAAQVRVTHEYEYYSLI